ncbi:hypothetical protein [Nostoc sp. PCC 7107]|nr:hypothetical protein [Nostoc sp. PCC 7107]
MPSLSKWSCAIASPNLLAILSPLRASASLCETKKSQCCPE